MMFNVLKNYHPMVGVDFHDAIFPPSAIPVKGVPHLCGAALCLGPWGAVTGKPNPTEVSASGGIMMSQGTDIGFLIPHYNVVPPAPPNALLPIIIGLSGSKSHFGAHKDMLPKGPVAFACLVVVNLNLNCAGPTVPPLPTGVVITFNTHVTGATIGDIVAGVVHMVVDGLIQFGLNRLFAGRAMSNLSERLAERLIDPILRRVVGYRILEFAFRYGLPQLGRFGGWIGAAADNIISNLFGTAIAIFGPGSPVGYSPGYTPIGGSGPVGGYGYGSGSDAGHGAIQRAVDNYFGSPNVEQHPTAGPPDAGTGGAGGAQPPCDVDDGGAGGSGGAGPGDGGAGGAPPASGPGGGGAAPEPSTCEPDVPACLPPE